MIILKLTQQKMIPNFRYNFSVINLVKTYKMSPYHNDINDIELLSL